MNRHPSVPGRQPVPHAPTPFSEGFTRPRHRRDALTENALAAFNHVSRRINDLARQLKCLGYFDDEDKDRPRAA